MKKALITVLCVLAVQSVTMLASVTVVVVNKDKNSNWEQLKNIRLEVPIIELAAPLCSKYNVSSVQHKYYSSDYAGNPSAVLYGSAPRITNLEKGIGTPVYLKMLNKSDKQKVYTAIIKDEFLSKDYTKLTLLYPDDFKNYPGNGDNSDNFSNSADNTTIIDETR